MIVFTNWNIAPKGQILGTQHDNKTSQLLVTGDMPQGWDWEAVMAAGGSLEVIPLAPCEGGVCAVLTAEQLAVSGSYALQLRGRSGDQVRHTNVIRLLVNASLAAPE